MEDFTYQKQGSIFIAKSDGFEYKSVGEATIFTQKKKIPSIRVVKTLIKLLKNI